MADDTSTIKLKLINIEALKKLKAHPRQSYNDVVEKLLKDVAEQKSLINKLKKGGRKK